MATISAAGLLAGTRITFDSLLNLYKVPTGTTAAEIQSVINTASYGATVQFEAGTHTLAQTLYVKRDGITLRGDASGESKIVLSSTIGKEGISFQGGVDKSYASTLGTDVARGSLSVTVQNATGLKVGDVIRVSQSNDLDFLTKSGYQNIIGDAALKDNPLRESISEVVRIEGNTVYLKQPVGYDMAAGTETKIERLNMLDDVALRDLTVTYDLGTPNADSFTNPLAGFREADAVVMNYTKGAEVTNLTLLNSASTALEMRNALEAHVNGLTVQGAFNKDSGNGYGLHIAGSFYSTYENLNITDVRHAVVFSSWNAEIGNTVHVANTNRDINYHGSDDYGNFVIVDNAVYDDGLESWSLVAPGGTSHAHTDINANTTLFVHAEGGVKADIIRGADKGSTLLGKAGNDQLFGGKGADLLDGGLGNDLLVGGRSADTMAGGAGRDTFWLQRGDGTGDVIEDFTAGRGGDVIRLTGYYEAQSFGELKLEQLGADTKLTLNATESLLLKNTLAAKLTVENFVIDYAEAPPPPTDPDMSFTATTKVDTFLGGSGNDTVTAAYSALRATDIIDLKDGTDTLKLTGPVALNALSLGYKGLDVLDLRSAGAVSKILLSDALVENSDNDRLTILYGNGGIAGLNTSNVAADNDVVLKGGAANITLANAKGNHVILENAEAATVKGGSSTDKIVVKGLGSMIDGGAGDDWLMGGIGTDTLTGGKGRDTFAYSDDSQFGDVIKDFSVMLATADTLDLTALFDANGLGALTTDSAMSGGYLQLTQQGGSTALLFDRDGSGGVDAARTVALLENVQASGLAGFIEV